MPPAAIKRIPLVLLNGGRNSRMTDLLLNKTPGSPIETPSSLNVEYKKIGGVGKRDGKSQRGDTISGSTYASQLVDNDDYFNNQQGSSNDSWIAQKFTTIGAVDVAQITIDIASQFLTSTAQQVFFYTDSAGSPGTLVTNASSDIKTPVSSSTPTNKTFTFSIPPSLGATTDFWIVVKSDADPGEGLILFIGGDGSTGSDVKLSNDGLSWSASAPQDPFVIFYIIEAFSASTSVQGLFDYQVDDGAGSFDQKVMVAVGGVLYKQNGPITTGSGSWTVLKSGLASGQDVLFDFTISSNLLYTTDYGNNKNQSWDGSNAATMDQGYRVTFAASDDATGTTGTFSATGWVRLMATTTMKSGGFRASATVDVNLDSTNDHINVNTIKADKAAGEFTFDVEDDATLWFMTNISADIPTSLSASDASALLDAEIFFKIPDAAITNPDTGGSTQPLSDAIDNFDIVTNTGLTSENQFIDEYSKDQGYFTGQIDTPKAKFMTSGFGFVVTAGDPNNQSRVSVSAQFGPQIWSTFGGTDGSVIEVGQENDGQSVRAVKFHGTGFYAFKDNDIYYYSFTGDAVLPFIPTRIKSNSMSCLSHFSIVEMPEGIIFTTQTGMGIIRNGSLVVEPYFQEKIGDLFENGNSASFNLASMKFATAANNQNKRLVIFGVSTNTATTRDRILVLDYELKNWSIRDGVSGNYLAVIKDVNAFPELWSGDYTAKLFKHDEGKNDDGSAISFEWETPWLTLGDTEGWKRIRRLALKGDTQVSGTLTVQVFKDYDDSTVIQTLNYDMTKALFKNWLERSVNKRLKTVKFKFLNSELDVDVQLNGISIAFQNLGAMK